MPNYYHLKKLIDGYRLGDLSGQTYVAIPENLHKNGVTVEFGGKTQYISSETPEAYSKTFPDKFNREKFYTLHYFLWQGKE